MERNGNRRKEILGRYQSGHCFSHNPLDSDEGRRKVRGRGPKADAGTGQLAQVMPDGMESPTYIPLAHALRWQMGFSVQSSSRMGADCCWIWRFHTVCRAWRRRSARERHAAAAWMLFGAASSRGLWDKSRRSHPGRLEMMEKGEKETRLGSWGG